MRCCSSNKAINFACFKTFRALVYWNLYVSFWSGDVSVNMWKMILNWPKAISFFQPPNLIFFMSPTHVWLMVGCLSLEAGRWVAPLTPWDSAGATYSTQSNLIFFIQWVDLWDAPTAPDLGWGTAITPCSPIGHSTSSIIGRLQEVHNTTRIGMWVLCPPGAWTGALAVRICCADHWATEIQ